MANFWVICNLGIFQLNLNILKMDVLRMYYFFYAFELSSSKIELGIGTYYR